MKHIDTARFCKENKLLAGLLLPIDLPRLTSEVLPESDFKIAWQAQGVSPDELELSIQTVVQMKCQRCLGAMPEAIDVSYRFQFVADEATAQAQDEENDEVDSLVHSRQFNLLELIEDEMLMALPFVSLHSICPEAGAIAFLPKSDKPNPFASLKNLKTVA